MPIYYACGIKVKLLVSPLPISTLTTTDPPDARQNTYERTKSIQQALDKASVLLEEPVPYHGDDRPPYFLEGDTTVPFFMVKVGKVASRPKNTKLQSKEIENEATSSLKITTASAEPSSLPSLPMLPTGRKQHPSNLSAASNTFSKLTEDMNSSLTAQRSAKNYAGQDSLWTHQKALSLDIEFDITRSFKRDRGKNLPIKTEVYINGELASCSYYGLHQRTEKPMKPQRHSGIRTGRVAELPWVLMTRDAPTADGSRPGRTGSDAVKRWMKISAALQVEATNCGHDRKGRQSPSGACLSALASMEIPNSILESVSPGSPSLGIIDVVITRGAGAKAPPEAGHLHKVQRLFDRQYASHAQVLGSAPDVIDLTVEPTPPTNAMETIMPDLLGLDGASDPKTPSHTPKRRATRSSAIVSPSADESEPDAEEKTESRESLGFLAAAQSVDPLLWDIAEPPIAAFAEMMSTKTRYGDLVVFSSDPVRSSPPPLQSLTDVSTGRSNRALARSARVDYSNGKRSRVVKLKNKRPQVDGSKPGTEYGLNQHAALDFDLMQAHVTAQAPSTPVEDASIGERVPKSNLSFTREGLTRWMKPTQATQTPPPSPPIMSAFQAVSIPHRPSLSSSDLSPLQRLARRPNVGVDVSHLKPVLALAEGEDAVQRMSGLQHDSSPMKNRELTQEFAAAVRSTKVPLLKMPSSIVKKLTGYSKNPVVLSGLKPGSGPYVKKKESPTDVEWDMPLMSRGCLLTYAHLPDGKRGSARQIKAERMGTFEEVDVLMAVRYLVIEGAGET